MPLKNLSIKVYDKMTNLYATAWSDDLDFSVFILEIKEFNFGHLRDNLHVMINMILIQLCDCYWDNLPQDELERQCC